MKKYRRYIIAAGLILLSALIIAGTVSVVTTSKYRAKINGYTDITPARFAAGLIRDYDRKQIDAANYNPNVNINFDEHGNPDEHDPIYYQSFSTLINHENLTPGMEIIRLPFRVTNGRRSENHASVDILYTIRIRTTNNLPLRYRLVRYSDEGVPKELYVTTGEYYLEYPMDKDAPKYVYTLHWADLVDERVDPDKLPENIDRDKIRSTEGYFGLTGGKFELDKYELFIDWPVVDSDLYGRKSNSSVYMKEVDVVDVIVTLESTDREYKSAPAPNSTIKSEGALFVYPEASDYTYESGDKEVYVQEFSGDYRAFLDETRLGSNKRARIWTVKLNNGCGLYVDGDILKATHPGRYSYSCVELTVPYDSDTKYYDYFINVPDLLDVVPNASYVLLEPYEIEYRSYNVKYDSPDYGTYTVIDPTDVTINDEFITSHGYGAADDGYGEYRLFVNYRFMAPGLETGTEYEYYLRMENFDQNQKPVRNELTLQVVIAAGTEPGAPGTGSEQLKELSEKDNPITLRVRTVWKGEHNYTGGVPADETHMNATTD